MFSGLDWFPTLLAAAGDGGVKDRLLKGWAPKAGGTSFKNHLDGYNQLPFLTGQTTKDPRTEFYYFDDDGRSGRHALGSGRQCVEGGVLRAAREGQPEYLAGPARLPASAEDIQPAHGSL